MLGRSDLQTSGIDVGHHPLTTTHLDELPRLGASAIYLRHLRLPFVYLRLPFVWGAHLVAIVLISSFRSCQTP